MPRIRYLKPDFFKDEDIATLPFWVRLLYAGLWTLADKAGRLEDRTKRIKAEVFPYCDVDIEKGLQMLAAPKKETQRPFIVRYSVDGERFIQILKWETHQKPHHTEKDSTIPPYNNTSIEEDIKRMEKGMGSVLSVKERLDNGCLTVKCKKALKTDEYQLFELAIFETWNDFCDKNPMLKKVKVISGTRRGHLKKRFTEPGFDFPAILAAVEEQRGFLIDKVGHGKGHESWTVSFDWIIKNDTNYVKVLERAYKKTEAGAVTDEAKIMEDWRKRK